MLSRTPWSVLGALAVVLLAVPGYCVEFNSSLLEGEFRPDGDSGKKSYSYFMELLQRASDNAGSSLNVDFYEDGSASDFEGTFLAFDDSAVEKFATSHGFSSAAEFNGSSYAMGDYAKQIIMLHKLDNLKANATDDSIVTAEDGSRLRIVSAQSPDGSGEVINQIYSPTLQQGDKLGKFPEVSGSVVDKTLESDDGKKRIVYVSKMFAPMSLINDLGSRYDNVYDAIKNTAELSFFKDLLDANPNITNVLKSPDYDGTVLAPHDEAFRLLLGGSGLSPSDFKDDGRFKSLGNEILRYHILPYNFSIGQLTSENTKGVIEGGRDRINDIARAKPGVSNGGGSNGPGNGNNPNARKLQQIENRFQTGRRHSDIRVITPSDGKAFIRGAAGNANLMTTESEMKAGNAYTHVVDQVILPQRIVARKRIEDLFSADIVPGGEEMAEKFSYVRRLLKNSGDFVNDAGNAIFLDGRTFVAPQDEPLKEVGKQRASDFFSNPSFDAIKNLPGDVKTLIEQHIIKWGPNDGEFEDGEVYETMAGSKVRYSFNVDNEESTFTVTDAPVTRMPDGSRRLLQEDSVEVSSGSSATTGDGTILYSSGGTLATEDGAFRTLPCLWALLAATIVLFAFTA